MGSLNPPPELTLDFKPTFIPKTISEFLRQLSTIANVSEKLLKIDDFHSRLETEMRKIDAFARELPLCMLLVTDAITTLEEESTVLKRSLNAEPVLEEFIPLKKSNDEDGEPEIIRKEKGGGDKKNWLSSTQLWNTNEQITKKSVEEEDDGMIDDPYQPSRNPSRPFIQGCCGFTMVEEEPIPGLSLITPGIKIPARGNLLLTKANSNTNTRLVPCSSPNVLPPQQQTSRKQRRCWSTDLHRRFVNALQQLGGSQAATPKQIRELMQVDGLTNDEVKSHLQKYRLHTRRVPSSNTSSGNQNVVLGGGLWMSSQDSTFESSKHGISQSGSPDGPLLIGGTTTTTTTTTGDNSMEDGEDEKSENYCWKGHHDV